MIVYAITNLINGKIYIGKHVRGRLHTYFEQIKRYAMNGVRGRTILHHAIRKYGAENFVITSLVEVGDKQQLSALERFFIRTLESTDPQIGYNLSDGGEGEGRSGHRHHFFGKHNRWGNHTDDAKRKISARISGVNNGSHKRKGPNHYNRGLVRSEETRRKLRESRALQDCSFRKRRFCKHGHDTSVCGRDRRGCWECRRLAGRVWARKKLGISPSRWRK